MPSIELSFDNQHAANASTPLFEGAAATGWILGRQGVDSTGQHWSGI